MDDEKDKNVDAAAVYINATATAFEISVVPTVAGGPHNDNVIDVATDKKDDLKDEKKDKASVNNWRHFFRIFTYCERIDVVVLVIGCLASIGGGIVSGVWWEQREHLTDML